MKPISAKHLFIDPLPYDPFKSWGKVISCRDDIDLGKSGATALQGRAVAWNSSVVLKPREYLFGAITTKQHNDRHHVVVVTVDDKGDHVIVADSSEGDVYRNPNLGYDLSDYFEFWETRRQWGQWVPMFEDQFAKSHAKRVAAFLVWKYELTGDNTDFTKRTSYSPEEMWVVADGVNVQMLTTNHEEAEVLAKRLMVSYPTAQWGPRTLQHHIDLVYQQGMVAATEE